MTRKQRHILGAIATVIIVATVFGAILSVSRRNTNKMLEVWGAEEREVKKIKANNKAAEGQEVHYISDLDQPAPDAKADAKKPAPKAP